MRHQADVSDALLMPDREEIHMDVYRTLNLAVPQLLFTVLHQAGPTVAEDDNNDFVPAGEMVKRLMEDNGHMAKMRRDAIAVCDKNRDSATSNALQEILEETERRKWFLFEIMQGVNNTD
jgi:DNA-binding ferritin-like protein